MSARSVTAAARQARADRLNSSGSQTESTSRTFLASYADHASCLRASGDEELLTFPNHGPPPVAPAPRVLTHRLSCVRPRPSPRSGLDPRPPALHALWGGARARATDRPRGSARLRALGAGAVHPRQPLSDRSARGEWLEAT